MELTVNRTTATDASTIGMLAINGVFECYTLEDKVREILGEPVTDWKIQNKTAIPVGRYQVIIDQSTRFGRYMPLLVNVPGYAGVRIHYGNDAADTDGCILVGNTKAADWIGNSRPAFDAFFAKLQAAITAGEEVFITLSNDYAAA